MYTIDFETKAIKPGSSKSPEPVGLAVKKNDLPGKYLSWGHINLDGSLQSSNNCTRKDAHDVLSEIWRSRKPIIMHNAKFDLRVCMEWFKLPYPIPYIVQDTMFLAFLSDPREQSLALKTLADKYLSMPPEEQDDLKAWILANVKGSTETNWGSYICYGPVRLNEKYAIGDVDRTYALYKYFKSKIQE